jgi:hypothetical protein
MAKLEMKSILAVFLMRYEHNLVDKDGKFPNPLPVPNRNDSNQVCKMAKVFCFGAHRFSSPICISSPPWGYISL